MGEEDEVSLGEKQYNTALQSKLIKTKQKSVHAQLFDWFIKAFFVL